MHPPTPSQCEDGSLTALLNRATQGDADARSQAFDCLWSKMEGIDHNWARRYGVVSGSFASEPVTFHRVNHAFDAALAWAKTNGFVFFHPGVFLKHLNTRLMFDNLSVLKTQAQKRRKRLSSLLSSCNQGLAEIAKSSELSVEERVENQEHSERMIQQLSKKSQPELIDELKRSLAQMELYFRPVGTPSGSDFDEEREARRHECEVQIAEIKQGLTDLEQSASTDTARPVRLLQMMNELDELEHTIWIHDIVIACSQSALTDELEQFVYQAIALQGLESKHLPQMLKKIYLVAKTTDEVDSIYAQAAEKVHACVTRKTDGKID